MKLYPLLSLLLLTATASATTWTSAPAGISSGLLENNTAQPVTHALGVITGEEALQLRVNFAASQLGRASSVRLTSLADAQSQTLTAATMQSWGNTSAIFNGEQVRIDLIIAPGETGIMVIVEEILMDLGAPGGDTCCPLRRTKTLCGPDSRVASTDNRIGRINGGCTGWLAANGAVLTAGHCNIAAGSIIEFNVPASTAAGARIAAAVQDQFPVIAGSITTVNNGVGDDWTVCRIGPNSLGQSAHLLHGFFRMTRELPGTGQTMRITGCGIDNTPMGTQPTVCGNSDDAGNCTHFGLNAQSQTLQTSAGTFSGETISGAKISLQYAIDTEPANSGSPVIWENTGFTVGIHTAGGCSSGGGANKGTSFELDTLENAIAAIPGANARYLDAVKAPGGAEDGTVFQPHDTLAEAVAATPSGGILTIVSGTYFGASNRGFFNKPMRLTAPVGTAILGP
jgi:V8-like Glu-specific endopeptidase